MQTRFSTALRQLPRYALLAALLCTSGCKDKKYEAELQRREQQAAARIAEAEQRETAADKVKQDAIGHEVKLKEREAELAEFAAQMAARSKELDKLEAEAKAAKVLFESKLLRGPVPDITAERVIVINPDDDEILYERNADRRGAIASTTKILTATLIIESGDMDKNVIVEDIDTRCAPVKMGLRKGETYTRKDLLTALMVKSSNDIARALARDNAGSIEEFVAKMNIRAKELGCKDCLFINPNGLPPEPGQPEPYCSARDLAKLAAHADKLPELREMVKLKTYVFTKADGKKTTLDNTNRVLRTCDYCDGMKTGYTEAAGHCLVASGQRDGRRRIVIVLNGTPSGVWRDAELLLMWALKA